MLTKSVLDLRCVTGVDDETLVVTTNSDRVAVGK